MNSTDPVNDVGLLPSHHSNNIFTFIMCWMQMRWLGHDKLVPSPSKLPCCRQGHHFVCGTISDAITHTLWQRDCDAGYPVSSTGSSGGRNRQIMCLSASFRWICDVVISIESQFDLAAARSTPTQLEFPSRCDNCHLIFIQRDDA
jgi:hypothetical protein